MKRRSLAIIALLLLTPILGALPVYGTITERPELYVVTGYTVAGDGTMTGVSLGPYEAVIHTKVDRYEAGHLVLIDMTGMTVSGAQVWLWLAANGGANIDPNDTCYAGPFLLNDITASVASYKNVTDPLSKETFYLGNYSIIGPMTTKLVKPCGAINYYLKITDVSPSIPNIASSDVAVSMNQWSPLPSIITSKSSGPACTLIEVTGIAFDPAKLANISFSASNTVYVYPGEQVLGLIAPDSCGGFVVTFNAPELYITDTVSVVRYVNAYYNGTATILDYRQFTERGRTWLQVKDLDSKDYWNNTWPAPDNGSNNTNTCTDVYVHDEVIVAGNYFNPCADVTLVWEYGTSREQVLGSVTPNATGFFNTTVIIPDAPRGDRRIWAIDKSLNFTLIVHLWPTLECVPNEGPVGTLVTVYAYALDASTMYYVYFEGLEHPGCVPNGGPIGYMWISNATTGSDGKFNVTVQFTVPHTYGGLHHVNAYLAYYGKNPDYIGDTPVASGHFTVTPLVWVEPSTVVQDGTKFYVKGTGFDPCIDYWTNVDNQAFHPGGHSVYSNTSGDVYIALIAAGFAPGWHVISFYPNTENLWAPGYSVADGYDWYELIETLHEDYDWEEQYAEPAFALFNVSSVGYPITDLIKAVNASVTQILTDPNGAFFVKMDTAVGQITQKLDNLNATVVAMKGDVATIKTSVGTFTGNVTDLAGNIAIIKTDVGTIKADAAAAKTAATAAQTAATSAKSGVDSMTTTLYIAVVLSLIAAVAAAICAVQLMRKLAG